MLLCFLIFLPNGYILFTYCLIYRNCRTLPIEQPITTTNIIPASTPSPIIIKVVDDVAIDLLLTL